MIPTRCYWSFIIFFMFIILSACANTGIVHKAVNKQEAALYYYEQGDHNKTEKYCKEAVDLWRLIKESNDQSVSDWWIEENISSCENILKLISTAEMSKASTSVPIRIFNNRVLVKAKLNGKEMVTLLLDTGATSTVISPNVADKLGIGPEENAPVHTVTVFGGGEIEVPFVNISKIEVADAVVNNITAGVYKGHPKGPSIDGILGIDFLNHFTVTINHNSSKLILESRKINVDYRNNLVGEWEGADRGNKIGVFIFSQDGKVDFIMEGKSAIRELSAGNGSIRYSFDDSTDPARLDLIFFNNLGGELKRLKMILKFLSSEEIMLKMSSNEEVPKNFTVDDQKQAIMLRKIR